MESLLQKRGTRLTLLVLIFAATIYGAVQLSAIFAPLLFSFLVAYMLDPVADALERRKFTRLAAVITIFFSGMLILVVLTGVIGFYLSNGLISLYRDVRGDVYYAAAELADQPALKEKLLPVEEKPGDMYLERNNLPGYQSGYLARSKELISGLEDRFEEGTTAQEVFKILSGWIEEKRTEYESQSPDDLKETIEDWLDQVSSAPIRRLGLEEPPVLDRGSDSESSSGDESSDPGVLGTLFSWISWLILCPLYIFYFLLEIDPLIAKAREYIPGKQRPRVLRILGKTDQTMAAFFRGRLTICLVKGAGTSIGLLILGVPFAVPLGIAAGFLALLPYVGIWIAVIPSLILVWLSTGSLGHILGVGAVFILMETLEGFWLIPRFLGKEVGLHPLTVIVTMLIFGEVFGFLGVLLSVPLAAISKILIEEFLMPLVEEFAAEKPDDPPPEAT